MKPHRKPLPHRKLPGLHIRQESLSILIEVLDRRHALGDVLAVRLDTAAMAELGERDTGFIRALVFAALRNLGSIDAVLGDWMSKPLPEAAGPAHHILRLALAEIGYLRTPAYAAGALAMELTAADPKARHFRNLVNAIVRRAGAEGKAALDAQPAHVRLPPWLYASWERAYGPDRTAAIIDAVAHEPPLDITLKPGEAAHAWAERLNGAVLATGSIRLTKAGRIEDLPGFAEGAWWVQDAAAALPARLLAARPGETVYDLCAAPGGKTLQLAALGADVTAVDQSTERLARIAANLKRTGLSAGLVAADVLAFTPARLADAVLLDAPCTATGTIRRHPDLPWNKDAGDVRALAEMQRAMLLKAVNLVRPGGRIVYSVCSLEPQEGEELIAQVLAAEPLLRLSPFGADTPEGVAPFLSADGTLRTVPADWPDLGGLDGFFAARLERVAA